jgi:hypothetical protein
VTEIYQALQRGNSESRRPGKDHAPVQMTGTRSRGGPADVGLAVPS